MLKKFYLDSCIWRDYFEDRKDNLRPLGEFAFRFLKKCGKNNWKVLYSEITIHELKNYYSDEKIKEVFSSFKDFIFFVSISSEQRTESKELALRKNQTHSADILHSILARDNDAVMVTRDKHFEDLKEIVQVMKPEEIIFC